MRIFAFSLCGVLLYVPVSCADIASSGYVSDAIETKVDTKAGTQQTLSGEYTVGNGGVLYVPTPALPQ